MTRTIIAILASIVLACLLLLSLVITPGCVSYSPSKTHAADERYCKRMGVGSEPFKACMRAERFRRWGG